VMGLNRLIATSQTDWDATETARRFGLIPLSMKTEAGVNRVIGLSASSRQGLIAVGEEWVQMERPQPRSGEDERPGPGTSRRQT
jgi:hypothetical protein